MNNEATDTAMKYLDIDPKVVTLEYISRTPKYLEKSFQKKHNLWNNPTTLNEYNEQIKILHAYNTIKSKLTEPKSSSPPPLHNPPQPINDHLIKANYSYNVHSIDPTLTPDDIAEVIL